MTTDVVPDTKPERAWHRDLALELRSTLTVVGILAGLAGIVFPLGVVGLGGLFLVWQGRACRPGRLQRCEDGRRLYAGHPAGPVAALEFIKNLGSSGGGFFNLNGLI